MLSKWTLISICVLFTSVINGQPPLSKLEGHWKGTLFWYRMGQAEPQKVRMELLVKPGDQPKQYHWKLSYGAPGVDTRPYTLLPVDSAGWHWLVDEQNGILIHHYWSGGRFSCSFTVQETTIVHTLYRKGKKLVAEFYSFSAQPVQKSGGSDSIPVVSSYGLKSFQKAVLKKRR